MTDPRATTRLTDGLTTQHEKSACKTSCDINNLSPLIGEIIECDCFGDGHYKSCILESWTKRTFKARYSRRGAKITMTIAFNGKGQHCFWRSLTSRLNYQFTRDEE